VIGSAHDDTTTGSTEGFGTNTHHASTLWGLAGDDTLDGGTDTDRCEADRTSTQPPTARPWCPSPDRRFIAATRKGSGGLA